MNAPIHDLLNVAGCNFRDCSFEANSYQAMVNGKSVSLQNSDVIKLGPGQNLVVSGNIQGLHIESNGGTLQIAPDTKITGLNISGCKLTLEAGQNVSVDKLNGTGTQFIDFRCGDNVRFTNSVFTDAQFSLCSEMGKGTSFENCNFEGCHLNCSLAEASLIGCSVSEQTRLGEAELERCSITDLKMKNTDGTSFFVENLSQLAGNGVTSSADTQISAAAQIQMTMANISGGQDCADIACQANLPNEAQKSIDSAIRHS